MPLFNSDIHDNVSLKKNSYSKQLPLPEIIQVVDFFCGCGGVSYGFKTTRQSHVAFKILAGFDIDEVALETYSHMVGAPGYARDISELADNPNELRRILIEAGLNFEKLFLFIGCAPCQGFSAHRKKHRVDDQRNSLPVKFAQICMEFKPHYIVMENVPEVFTGRFKGYMNQAFAILENASYKLSRDILDLSLYGVPQRRRRAIVLGTLSDRELKIPGPIFTEETAVTVREAIAHLTPLKSGETSKYDPWHKAPGHTERILEMIRKIPSDGGDRRSLDIDEQLDCHKKMSEKKAQGFTDVYGRLYWDRPSVSITAKSSTPSCGRFLHPEQHRNISIREAGILQGFPAHFEFKGSMINQYRQIGEAVPPLFCRFLAWSILDHYNPIDKPEFLNFHPVDLLQKAEKNITMIEAFCGAGGMSLGAIQAGADLRLGFDINESALRTHEHNIKCSVQILDISKVSAKNLLRFAGLSEPPDILAGGPPCQGFSQQRRGDNADERNNLVYLYAKLAIALRPKAIILENVTYLDSPRGRDIMHRTLDLWENNGYSVFRHDLNSVDFGVPQLRSRIIIVALQKRYSKVYNGPQKTTPNRWYTVGEVLQELPEPTEGSIGNHAPSNEGELNKKRIAYVGMGEGRLSVPPDLQLKCHTTYDGHLDVFGRLDWFSQARTITGGFDSFTRGEYGHPFRHRSITHREAARIQGFPDWFTFLGNKADVRGQIGNAVPPPMAKALVLGIMEAIISQ